MIESPFVEGFLDGKDYFVHKKELSESEIKTQIK